MAEVTYKTQMGTEITLRNIQSNSTFEIIKAAVPMIEAIELAEANGTADELFKDVMVANIGESGGLVITTDLAGFLEQPIAPDDDDDELCPECQLERNLDCINESFDCLEGELDQFIKVLDGLNPDDVLDIMGVFSKRVKLLSDEYDNTHPAKQTIFGIGAGVSIAVNLISTYLLSKQAEAEAAAA
jgi:hypothetical protein